MEKTSNISLRSSLQHTSTRRLALALGVACLTLVACTERTGSGVTPEPSVALTDTRCANCHRKGDIGPFSLTNYEEVRAVASILPASIESGSMPPWSPSADCNDYAANRSLSGEERKTLLDWLATGAPEGDPALAPPAPALNEFKTDMLVSMPATYKPTVAPDEYRCFVLPWDQTGDAFITGYEVRPGNRAMVHHVTIGAVAAGDIAALTELENADPAPGYSCFGGLGVRANSFGGWAPGAPASVYPQGTGVRVAPGSRIVLQMHYATGAASALGDQTSVAFRIATSVERPLGIIAVTNPGWTRNMPRMLIPAGNPEVKHSATVDFNTVAPRVAQTLEIPAGSPMLVHEVGLHMHTRGTRAQINVIRPDGQTKCALAINAWDFNWQGRYRLQTPLEIGTGDRFEIQCTWDNSAAKQPYVNGRVTEPVDLSWGEGTGDEMCLGSFVVGGK
jgi:Copper type II ascorbate-dependent monooxygenase, C-terminal domain